MHMTTRDKTLAQTFWTKTYTLLYSDPGNRTCASTDFETKLVHLAHLNRFEM